MEDAGEDIGQEALENIINMTGVKKNIQVTSQFVKENS